MTFLVDTHLPVRLVIWLRERGATALHTRELLLKNATEDKEILRLSVAQNMTIISKYAALYKHFILKGQPPKPLFLTMGNMVNHELILLFENNIEQIESALQQNKVVELSNGKVTVHF